MNIISTWSDLILDIFILLYMREKNGNCSILKFERAGYIEQRVQGDKGISAFSFTMQVYIVFIRSFMSIHLVPGMF